MHTQRLARTSLTGALALAAFGFAAAAIAQTPPPVNQQGAENSATFPLPDSHGGTLTVRTGMLAQLPSYGPWPSFKSLDANHDGRISEQEAKAYAPLENDFLQVSGGAKFISRGQYEAFVKANPRD